MADQAIPMVGWGLQQVDAESADTVCSIPPFPPEPCLVLATTQMIWPEIFQGDLHEVVPGFCLDQEVE